MADHSRLNAIEFLDRFFDVVREEAQSNPSFAARLVQSLGGEIVFDAQDAVRLANPIDIAARKGVDGLRATFGALDRKDLVKVLKAHNLATPIDMRSRSQAELVAMLEYRAAERLKARTS